MGGVRGREVRGVVGFVCMVDTPGVLCGHRKVISESREPVVEKTARKSNTRARIEHSRYYHDGHGYGGCDNSLFMYTA